MASGFKVIIEVSNKPKTVSGDTGAFVNEKFKNVKKKKTMGLKWFNRLH